MQVLTTRSALLDHYNPIMAGLENITAFLDGRGLDDNLLGSAFAESWSLDARYPADLAGHAYVKGWSSLVFGTVVLTRPKQQNITSAKTLEFTSKAAASWPTAVRIGSFDSLLRFEAACQQEAEARMREGGLPALWKLTEDRTKQYRQTTEQFIG
uniref:Uncharacterized protein n=1 Tax=Streptomyces ambofaciens (strain ATCC 23877 / 3486 / DSM 40053 / JCM 4204 / NBRC 12836 / NRRL B-2516) TaxID=278992 RepID=A3KIH0_STRA7|nr:hypothetical protein SAML0515 [Streptomyces ambofaciens ATCC 23877]